jgi:hypothetical protein
MEAAAGSFFIDRACAERAVAMSLPMITEAMKDPDVCGSGFLYLVVMNPTLTPANASFHDAILYEHAIGDTAKWDADYGEFARAKARVAWHAGMDSHKVQELRPHMLTARDTTLWGSVAVDGIIVGASGAYPWYDEAFAGTVAMCLRALAKAGADRARRDGPFLPAERGR